MYNNNVNFQISHLNNLTQNKVFCTWEEAENEPNYCFLVFQYVQTTFNNAGSELWLPLA